MIDLNKLDVFKNEFLDFLKSRSQGSLGMDDLYLEEGYLIKDSIEDSHKKLDFAIDLFLKAKDAGSLVVL